MDKVVNIDPSPSLISAAEKALSSERNRVTKNLKSALSKALKYHLGEDQDVRAHRLSVLGQLKRPNTADDDRVLAIIKGMRVTTFKEAAFMLAAVHEIVYGDGKTAQKSSLLQAMTQFQRILVDKSRVATAVGLLEDDEGVSLDQPRGNTGREKTSAGAGSPP